MHVYVLAVTPESQPPLPPGSSVISNQQNIACHTAHSNIHCQTNNHACEPEVNITSNHHAKEAFFASCAHASKNTAQSWAASPKLTKYRSETTPQAVHVYVQAVTSESPPPLPPGSSVISNQQNIACHTAHSNIHCQTNNHACEPEVNITSNHHAKEAFFASCAHASKNTAQSWDASPKLTKYRSETTPQAVHVYVHPVTPESQPPLPPGSSVISNQQNIACHTAHSNIHCQTNNHACEPEVNITSNHHAKEAFFASCAHASKNTAQSWAASPKLTKYRSETTPQAVHVCMSTVPGSSVISNQQNIAEFKYPLSNKQPHVNQNNIRIISEINVRYPTHL